MTGDDLGNDVGNDLDDRDTGLPILKTWPAVYLLVTALFAVYLAGLALLSGHSW
jgi:hypothetical protein